MAVSDLEEISIGAAGGAFIPTVLDEMKSGETGPLPGPVPDTLNEYPVQIGAVVSVLGIGLPFLESRGYSPIRLSTGARNVLAGAGASSAAVTAGMILDKKAPAKRARSKRSKPKSSRRRSVVSVNNKATSKSTSSNSGRRVPRS